MAIQSPNSLNPPGKLRSAPGPGSLLKYLGGEALFWGPFVLVPMAARAVAGEEMWVKDLVAGIGVSAALALVGNLLGRFKSVYRIAVFVPLFAGSLIVVGTTLAARGPVTSDTMTAVADTAVPGMREFVAQYYGPREIGIALLLFLPLFAFRRRPRSSLAPRQTRWINVVCLAVAVAPAAGKWWLPKDVWCDEPLSAAERPYFYPWHRYPPFQPLVSLAHALEERDALAAGLRPIGAPLPVSRAEPSLRPELLVLVIGESLSRHHMSIYGYPRPTNPKLEARSGEIYLFRDVIAPHAYTSASLEKALSFWTPSNGEIRRGRSLFEAFKESGFRTYWISNQPRQGFWETATSKLASDADRRLWVNLNEGGVHGDRYRAYDSNVLPALAEALKDPEREKFIAIHLMGNHLQYQRRYPPEFDAFNGPVPGRSPAASAVIDAYDNAALYNDTILDEIIRLVAARSQRAMILYFSDHGEEVFDYRVYRGHGGAEVSRFMTDIPFLLWVSEQHRRDHTDQLTQLSGYLDRPFSIGHLAYALADLAGLSFAEFDETLSLFSERFKPRPRFVGATPYGEIQQRSPATIAGSLTEAPSGCRS